MFHYCRIVVLNTEITGKSAFFILYLDRHMGVSTGRLELNFSKYTGSARKQSCHHYK